MSGGDEASTIQAEEEADDSLCNAGEHQVDDVTSTCQSSDDSQLAEIYARFESFNFDEDEKFQSGLSRIATVAEGSGKGLDKDMNRIRAFYYTRNIEFFYYAVYMRWRQDQHIPAAKKSHDDTEVSGDSKCTTTSDDPYTQVCVATVQASADTSTASHTHDREPDDASPCENVTGQNICVGNASQRHSTSDFGRNAGENVELSFAEIAELIQEGKPLPGLTQVEVVPTNLSPTPSSLPRAQKPWER